MQSLPFTLFGSRCKKLPSRCKWLLLKWWSCSAFEKAGVLWKTFTGPAIALLSLGMFVKWRWVPCVCPYELSPLDDTMTLATRSTWTLKPRPFCLFWRVCYKPRIRAGFENLSVNWSHVFPKCKQVWAEWAQFQMTVGFMIWGGNHLNIWLATRLILAVVMLGGPLCIWNKISEQGLGNRSLLQPKQKGFAQPCTELLKEGFTRLHCLPQVDLGMNSRAVSRPARQ